MTGHEQDQRQRLMVSSQNGIPASRAETRHAVSGELPAAQPQRQPGEHQRHNTAGRRSAGRRAVVPTPRPLGDRVEERAEVGLEPVDGGLGPLADRHAGQPARSTATASGSCRSPCVPPVPPGPAPASARAVTTPSAVSRVTRGITPIRRSSSSTTATGTLAFGAGGEQFGHRGFPGRPCEPARSTCPARCSRPSRTRPQQPSSVTTPASRLVATDHVDEPRSGAPAWLRNARGSGSTPDRAQGFSMTDSR